MSIFKEFNDFIIQEIVKFFNPLEIDKFIDNIVVEIPRENTHGDLSTNAALVLAKPLKQSPKAIAQRITIILENHPEVINCNIAGPGFVNFNLKNSKWHQELLNILNQREKYGHINIGQNTSINIEYVSCNPTGPMHVGHTRCAVYGDALANILEYAGYDVTREFYINDAGTQLDILARTVFLRYQEALTGEKIEIPEGLYPGEYLIPVGKELAKKHPNLSIENDIDLIKKESVVAMMKLIKDDLANLGIQHDIFFSEKSLHDQNKISEIVEEFTKRGLVYKGKLPPPKGKPQDNFEPVELLLFKSTLFGDDQDRSLQKRNKDWSYFAPELAYLKNKIERKFNVLVLILGVDHIGYIKKTQAVCRAIDPSVDLKIITCQLVNYMKGSQAIKMSKRSGNFLCARDIIEMVGSDALRFMMLTRKNDAVIDFDVEKVLEYSKDNPVFYVQYAHVRSLSLQKSAQEVCPTAYEDFISNNFDLSLLNLSEEIDLIKSLSLWPKIFESAVRNFEPHKIVFYLQDLAANFHSLWQLYKNGQQYRFVVNNNKHLTAARLALIKGIQVIIANGLKLVGVKPMDKM